MTRRRIDRAAKTYGVIRAAAGAAVTFIHTGRALLDGAGFALTAVAIIWH